MWSLIDMILETGERPRFSLAKLTFFKNFSSQNNRKLHSYICSYQTQFIMSVALFRRDVPEILVGGDVVFRESVCNLAKNVCGPLEVVGVVIAPGADTKAERTDPPCFRVALVRPPYVLRPAGSKKLTIEILKVTTNGK